MHLPDLSATAWLCGVVAALMTGFSKTGIPGSGILVVPLMATAFGGRLSVGALLPMLIMGDLFAIAWYRRHGQLDQIWKLAPWVVAGMALGGLLLWGLGEQKGAKDSLNVVIGAIVLAMVAINLLRKRMGDRLAPHTKPAVILTGTAAGFSTTVSNAAGPIMSLYLQGMGMPKQQFMGTSAWYFFLFNSAKLPIFLLLVYMQPDKPLMTGGTLLFDLAMFPVIVVGAFLGRWLLPRLSQGAFEGAIVVLAAIAAVRLILSP